MNSHFKVVIIGAAMMHIGTAPAAAQTPNVVPMTRCQAAHTPVDQVIAACTAVLQASNQSPQSRAAALERRGHAYEMIGARDRAFADFNQAIALNPKFASAYEGRGVEYGNKSGASDADYDRAIADLQQAIRLDPQYAHAVYLLGYVFEQGKHDKTRARQEYDRALSIYRQNIARDPNNAINFLGRGEVYVEIGDPASAIRDFNQALVLDPEGLETLEQRGIAYWWNHDTTRAVADFDHASRLDLAVAWAWCNLDFGRIVLALRPYTGSQRASGCTAVIQAGKEPPEKLSTAFTKRALVYLFDQEIDLALADYGQAVRLDPDPRNLSIRGNVYYELKQYDRAFADYDEAVKRAPDDAANFYRRGNAAYSKRDYERTIQDYAQAEKLAPGSIGDTVSIARASATAFLGFDPARTFEAKDWRDQEIIAGALNGRCWNRAMGGQLDEAKADCEKSLELNRDPHTFDSLALVWLKSGRLDDAISNYSEALQSDPKLAGSLYGRGLAKVWKGDKTGGEADIAAAKVIDSKIAEKFKAYNVRQPTSR